SGTASTILAGPAGALGFTGELAADLFDPLNAYNVSSGSTHGSWIMDNRWHLQQERLSLLPTLRRTHG
ncbi:MAG: hypothetical protein JXA30_05785, partial [Deltaproteobacteria bacterium]|nr:hypothetical protein [Deltaproteobacteria bacterium]